VDLVCGGQPIAARVFKYVQLKQIKLTMPNAFNLQGRARMAVSALILLIMLPNLIWLWIGHGFTIWMSGLIVPILLMTFLFAIFGKRVWLACVLLTPFAALAPIEALYVFTYLHPTNAGILATLGATNPREMYEYLGCAIAPILICVTAGLLLAFLAIQWSWQSDIRWNHRSRGWAITTAITLPLAMGVATFVIPARLHARAHMISALSDSVEPGYPFGLFLRIAEYQSEWRQVRIDAARLDAFRFHAHRSSTIGQRQVYVLVIGESSRRDHWQIFGYQRATNPELLKTPNLVLIPNMLTSWPISIMAIPLLLTRKPITETQMPWKEASILRAMHEAGFDTWWISNQLPMGKFDSPVSTYALEADHTIYLNHASLDSAGSYDEDLLQPLSDVLQKSHGDLFIVLHMMGSHLSYDMRYPATFKQFTPTYDQPSTNVLPGERFTNSYDNTILYTDHVLAQVIDILRNNVGTAAMFYASDHGEALLTPTCSKAGHGFGTRNEFEIPALFWYSDAYATAFPQRLSSLRANADKPTLSADTFESLIDMAGVDFPEHDPSQSLFSTQWRYRPRIVNPIWQVDFDKAIFEKRCETVLPPIGTLK
jgi:glucan phosphoethanolaminetransferase (alkaline phosphatase superfamily)